ncbi:unnamed protein product [Cylicostephanus goldi]|uniref:Uncharacterized protein n=1 Tax=Cylicostephanus goldi TaxID=71465 RepID=A0A3P6RAZ0_CYLGO|nr:unnamed protein product [Cylicostephanus goldi]
MLNSNNRSFIGALSDRHSADFVARGCGVSLLTTAAGLPNESCHQAIGVCEQVGGRGSCYTCKDEHMCNLALSLPLLVTVLIKATKTSSHHSVFRLKLALFVHGIARLPLTTNSETTMMTSRQANFEYFLDFQSLSNVRWCDEKSSPAQTATNGHKYSKIT